jgi:hypothetical protein
MFAPVGETRNGGSSRDSRSQQQHDYTNQKTHELAVQSSDPEIGQVGYHVTARSAVGRFATCHHNPRNRTSSRLHRSQSMDGRFPPTPTALLRIVKVRQVASIDDAINCKVITG